MRDLIALVGHRSCLGVKYVVSAGVDPIQNPLVRALQCHICWLNRFLCFTCAQAAMMTYWGHVQDLDLLRGASDTDCLLAQPDSFLCLRQDYMKLNGSYIIWDTKRFVWIRTGKSGGESFN